VRLPHPQQIEIGTVEDHHSLHGVSFLKSYRPSLRDQTAVRNSA
jgi:hypothetical protein